jgi:hypothetical protein
MSCWGETRSRWTPGSWRQTSDGGNACCRRGGRWRWPPWYRVPSWRGWPSPTSRSGMPGPARRWISGAGVSRPHWSVGGRSIRRPESRVGPRGCWPTPGWYCRRRRRKGGRTHRPRGRNRWCSLSFSTRLLLRIPSLRWHPPRPLVRFLHPLPESPQGGISGGPPGGGWRLPWPPLPSSFWWWLRVSPSSVPRIRPCMAEGNSGCGLREETWW